MYIPFFKHGLKRREGVVQWTSLCAVSRCVTGSLF
jgi:hypothetical protein